jgi:cell division protein FtsI/penicillin-binding protein 2
MLFWLFAFLYVLLIGRLARVQWLDSSRYAAMARSQQFGDIDIPAVRGEIRDTNNVVLVSSLALFSVAADPTQVKDPAADARILSPLLKLSVPELERRLRQKTTFQWLGRKCSDKVSDKIKDLALDGIFLLREPIPSKRFYPKGRLAAHLLGATGTDETGLDGLEAAFDKYLAGQSGTLRTFMDRDGWAMPVNNQRLIKTATPGRHVQLTIDETIQYVAQREISAAVKKFHAKGGICLVMDVKTGGVLAMALAPDFSSSDYSKVPASIRRNRALTDPYEPGSTFKVFTAATALDCGIAATDRFSAGGTYSVNGYTIHNDEADAGAGVETLADIVAYSLNVGTARVALKIGKKRLAAHLSAFGFGHRTGIDLEGEGEGILSNVKDWQPLNTCTISFGQGVAVTPIQLVSGMQAIANGGVRMRPHVVKAILNPDGSLFKTFKPKVLDRPISKHAADEMVKILRSVCSKGTGKKANIAGYRVGGKTGTAQVAYNGSYASGKYTASFLGLAPIEHPRIVCLVKVEEPFPVYYGGLVSAPTFARVVAETLWKLGVAPSHPEEMVANKQGDHHEQ